MTNSGFTFTISSLPFDEDYRPADNTRITTNFANLARGESAGAEIIRKELAARAATDIDRSLGLRRYCA